MTCLHRYILGLNIALLILFSACPQSSALAAETSSGFLSPIPNSNLETARTGQTPDHSGSAVVRQGGVSYENSTVTEDVTWRGTVLVRGYLVISQQATVRVEPGTTVRFIRSAILRQPPRLVVMGRFHCEGTMGRPVLFTSDPHKSAKGDWGGILFLASEKRNRMEHFKIEGAETALELRHSAVALGNGSIARSDNGILAGASSLNMKSISITGANRAVEVLNSELELHDSIFSKNHDGIMADHSTLVLVSSSISGSVLHGISAKDCRLKIRSSEITDNSVGAVFTGGEGQVFLSRFTNNRETALHLSGARVKVNRSLFSNNLRDAVRVDDGQSLFMENVFSGNKGYNMINAGRDNVAAVQNWWGSSSESAVISKLHDDAADSKLGKIMVLPWLAQKPAGLPF